MRATAAGLMLAATAGAAEPVGPPAWAGRQYQAVPGAARAQVASAGDVRLARWPGDRAAAFSFIFDDGSTDHIAIVVPALEANGLRGTFALVTGKVLPDAAAADAERLRRAGNDPAKAATLRRLPTWDDWREAARHGHELANHSISHPGLDKLDAGRVAEEISGAVADLQQKAGVRAMTFVGPYNQYGPGGLELVQRTHLCWRIGGGIGYGRPKAGEAPAETAAAWTARLHGLIATGGWSLSMIHAIIDGYEPTGEEAFRLHLAQAAALGDRLWIAPAGEVARYDLAVRHARLAIEPVSPQAVRLRVEAGLDDPLLAVPLTVVVATPEPAASAAASRGQDVLPCRIDGRRLLVEAVPAPEPIEVTWR